MTHLFSRLLLDTAVLVVIVELITREDRPEVLQVAALSLGIAILHGPMLTLVGFLLGLLPLLAIDAGILLLGLKLTWQQAAFTLAIFLVLRYPLWWLLGWML